MAGGHDQYIVEGCVGLTGSGKTTWAMVRAVEMMARYLKRGIVRPIYTNVGFSVDGMRHHLLRRYARSFLAGECPEGRRDRFVRDPSGRLHHCPRGRLPLHRFVHHLDDAQVVRWWDHVPLGSIVIIDEIQAFFPQSAQHKGEDPEFVKYLTQHRKLRHSIIWLTQFDTLVSHSVRKVTHQVTRVQNLRQRALDLGFWKMPIPWDGFFYCTRYSCEPNGPIVNQRMYLAATPSNRWAWDLFESRTLHGGMDKLREGRAEGVFNVKAFKRAGTFESAVGYVWRNKIALAALGLAFMAFRGGGGGGGGSDDSKPGKGAVSKAVQIERRLLGVTGKSAMVDGIGRVAAGEFVGPYQFGGVDDGTAVFVRDGVRVPVRVGGVLNYTEVAAVSGGGGQ